MWAEVLLVLGVVAAVVVVMIVARLRGGRGAFRFRIGRSDGT